MKLSRQVRAKDCMPLYFHAGESAQICAADLLLQGGIGPRVSGLTDRHQLPAVSHVIITCAQRGADIEGAEPVQIFLFHCPGGLPSFPGPGITAVNIFAVNSCHSGRVDRFLHAPFYFEGTDSCIDQIRQDLENTHILHGKGIDFLFPGIRSDRLSLFIQNSGGKPACSRAPSPVSAPSAQKTGHQASSRIGIAHSPVDERLYFYRTAIDPGVFSPELLYFSQGKFPGGDDAGHAQPAQKLHRFG